jgi:DNA polymerase IV
MLLDSSAQRFAVKGAPQRKEPSQTARLSQISSLSQTSLQVKPSKRQIEAQGSQKTDSHPTEESVPSTHPAVGAPSSPCEDTVKDSFIMPSSDPVEAPEPKVLDHFNDALSQAILETKAFACDDASEAPEQVQHDLESFGLTRQKEFEPEHLPVYGSRRRWLPKITELERSNYPDLGRDGQALRPDAGPMADT